jgi:hypothetical protein
MSWSRFLRNLAAIAAAAVVKYTMEHLTQLQIPLWLVPLAAALLNAIADWLRDNFAPQALRGARGLFARVF